MIIEVGIFWEKEIDEGILLATMPGGLYAVR